MKKLLFAFATALMLSACASAPEANAGPADEQDARNAIQEAETAVEKTASVDNLWRDTEDFLEQARTLAKEGKYDEAVKMAGKAEEQANLAYAQWEIEREREPATP